MKSPKQMGVQSPNAVAIPTGALDAALPEVNQELAKMQQNIVIRAFKAVAENALSPELAKDLWHQMASTAELQRRLNTRNAIGTAEAEKRMAAIAANKG